MYAWSSKWEGVAGVGCMPGPVSGVVSVRPLKNLAKPLWWWRKYLVTEAGAATADTDSEVHGTFKQFCFEIIIGDVFPHVKR